MVVTPVAKMVSGCKIKNRYYDPVVLDRNSPRHYLLHPAIEFVSFRGFSLGMPATSGPDRL
jgi:hypothetical protein